MIYSLVEWTWTLIALVGFCVGVWSIKLAQEDLTYLRDNNFNGRRKIVAAGHRRREAMRALIQALGLYVGIYALRLPNPPGVRINAATACLMFMQFFVVLNTISDLRDRFRLVAYWKRTDLGHVSDRDEQIGAVE